MDLPPLSEIERAMLQRIHRQHSKAYMRDRAHMVLLSDQGYTQRDIADILHTTARTVHRILSRYRQNRLAGLCRKPGSGALSRLDGKQLDTLSQWVVEGPSLLGYCFVLWTTKTYRLADASDHTNLCKEQDTHFLYIYAGLDAPLCSVNSTDTSISFSSSALGKDMPQV